MALSSNIPSIALQKLVPIVQGQLTQLVNIGSYIENSMNSLPGNVKCSDNKITDIKQRLKNVNDILTNIRKLQTTLKTINTTFGTLQIIANAVKLVQLLIPAVLGVPQAPFALLATTVDVLAKNCQASSAVLLNISITMNMSISKIESIVSRAIIKLSSICVNETFDVSPTVSAEINKNLSTITSQANSAVINPNSNVGSSSTGAATFDNSNTYGNGTATGSYTSFFYTEDNVAQSDIDTLETIVTDLNNLQKSLTENIIEAPSNIIINTGAPAGTNGNIGDFYIDSANNLIYGPKVSNEAWPSPIKY